MQVPENEVVTDSRLQFIEIMLNIIEEDPAILDNIVWTNEASFNLSGHVNRYNCVYWYSENKHLTIRFHMTSHIWRKKTWLTKNCNLEV